MSIDTKAVLGQLLEGESLDEATAKSLLHLLGAGQVEPALAGALLASLRMKGETAAEIRGFALGMRELARRPLLPHGDHVDVVGTGGDGSGSLNLSTGSALLAAACGASVVKHGNRSISSQSGSADVLMSLGLPLPLDEHASGECLAQCGFTFLFAPHYHPAMQYIAPVRAALGARTVFNILGPLTNPAEPPYHVIGAYSEQVAQLIAQTLAGMPIKRAFVIHGADGWDEATPLGTFVCFDVGEDRVMRTVRDPLDAGIERCVADELRGGTPDENCRRLRGALAGGDTPAHRDALSLGAALALEVTGQATSMADGVAQARAALESGKGTALLERLSTFSAQT
ncbi:MAG: anthranilate phosphoribosyltransferase [Gammaproteobacteria bacterium]|jgi:anthranilate phosphoribosyltransferase